jgi:hypothetical protein
MIQSRGFFVAADSPDEKWSGVVEDDGETAYFYLQLHGRGVQDSILLYHSNTVSVSKCDVEINWTTDSTKCGVAILGVYRAIFDLKSSQKLSRAMGSWQAEGIQSKDWLLGLPKPTGMPRRQDIC